MPTVQWSQLGTDKFHIVTEVVTEGGAGWFATSLCGSVKKAPWDQTSVDALANKGVACKKCLKKQ